MVSIQKQNAKRVAKASRAKYDAPKKLLELFELVNLVPPDVELPSLGDARETAEAEFEVTSDLASAIENHVKQPLFDALRALPKQAGAFKDFVMTFEGFDGERFYADEVYEMDDIDRAASRYSFIRSARAKLRSLMTLASRPHNRRGLWLWEVPLVSGGSIYLDENNIVQATQDGFSQAVIGVDASRIRNCEHCKRFFWAARGDQTCCSKEHAHALRSQRWRDNYQSKYKIRRIEGEGKKRKVKSTKKGK